MALRIVAVEILVCLALLRVVVAQESDVCIFLDEACTDEFSRRCSDISSGSCSQLRVPNKFDILGAVITCSDDGASANVQVWNDDDCLGDAILSTTIESGECFLLSREDIYIQIDCDQISIVEDCFSGESIVNLADGAQKKVSEVQVGDLVESFTADGRRTFSEVYVIQHKDNDKYKSMKTYHYEAVDGSVSGAITLTKRHLVRLAADQDLYIASQEIKEGHRIMVHVAGKESAVEATVLEISRSHGSIRNILTLNDRIVVDGVLASTGTDILPLWIQKILVVPLKVLYSVGLGELANCFDAIVHKTFVSYQKRSIFTRIE